LKIDFKPEDSSKLKLFANRGEAVVFWLCIGGLCILTLFTVLRYYSINRLKKLSSFIEGQPAQMLSKIDDIEKQNIMIKAEYDNLETELEQSHVLLKTINTELDNMKIKLHKLEGGESLDSSLIKIEKKPQLRKHKPGETRTLKIKIIK